ncbi:MAG: hypothetical protein CSA68_10890 [Rhodobacterales bacterium]|nr:MAG: hypothetical protein CSA68_10890 [Rhodobacterales bacterium]
MRVVITAIDKAGAQQLRLDNRQAHLDYVAQTGVVEMAGPFLDARGQMCGSLLILSVQDVQQAESWAENDPYAKAGLFETVSIRPWKKVIG